jgi:hypothetical protein
MLFVERNFQKQLKMSRKKIIPFCFYSRYILGIVISIFIFSLSIKAQTIESTNKDSIVFLFINSQEVISGFKYCRKPDTGFLVILDPDSLLIRLNPTTWFGHMISIINSGELIDSINRFDPNYVIKNRNNYFILRTAESPYGTELFIHAPYTNLYSLAVIKKKKKIYQLGKIECGVI